MTAVSNLADATAHGFARVDERFEAIDKRFDRLENKFDQVEFAVFKDHEPRIQSLEKKFK